VGEGFTCASFEEICKAKIVPAVWARVGLVLRVMGGAIRYACDTVADVVQQTQIVAMTPAHVQSF